MDRTSISRRIGSIKGDIEKLSNTLCAIEKTDIENYPDNYAMLTTDAALRSELIACRMRHLLYGSTATRKETYLASAGVVQGIRIQTQENMLEITLPCLLPKRKQRQSTEFLIDPLYFTLSQYSDNNGLPKFRQCVVCFSHIYSEKFHNRRVRDYDNLELKQLLDVLSTFIMVDDMVMRMGYSETGEYDKDRNFIYSKKGTYGTSGFMSEKEAEEIFDLRTSLKNHNGTIFGLLNGRYVCMPEESMLNKNVAVYGASGSMKTRAYCINRILQATVPNKDGKMESLIICDPKSELYEKTSELLRKTHTVKVFNLVCPENSDSWNCLAEIEGDELMAQRFCDVIIKNTGSERGDHFWDSAEMNLLKALVLYVEQGYLPERKNIGQVYRLLTHCDEKELNSLFNMLPSSHPAKAPYAIFQQASDTVRSGVIIGLGSRLQVFQNKSICNMTAFDEIDMELPGQQPCAYFCITSDQDSTFDFLSSLFLSFVFIKLVRYADKNCEGGKLPIPVHVLGEELTACGVIPDLSRKISVIRSRNISMSCVFQNLAGLQNQYPLNQWQEILGNSDVQLFLGCVDELTAKYISDRSGEVSVHVQSKAKQLGTWRISNYTPEYRETSGVGKRKLLTMDEVLRLPISKALIIIRGRKLLQVDKCDYTEHPESKKMISCKASAHIPEWQKQQPKEVKEVSPAPIKKPGRKKKTPASNVVPTDKDSIMSKN